MPTMNPYPAVLGSRPARSTGESKNNQRVDGDFKEILDKYGDVEDLKFHKGVCQNPACSAIGQIFRKENSFNICLVCFTIQNDGVPEGVIADKNKKISNRAKKRLNERLIYDCLHTSI